MKAMQSTREMEAQMRPKKVKYLVSESRLGDFDKGEFTDAFILIRDGDSGLLLHPPHEEDISPYRASCASLELGKLDGELWGERSKTAYLNLHEDDYELLLAILKRTGN